MGVDSYLVLPAFDFLAHLILGLDNHVRGLNYNVTQKLAINEPKSSELTVNITIVHLVTRLGFVL